MERESERERGAWQAVPVCAGHAKILILFSITQENAVAANENRYA